MKVLIAFLLGIIAVAVFFPQHSAPPPPPAAPEETPFSVLVRPQVDATLGSIDIHHGALRDQPVLALKARFTQSTKPGAGEGARLCDLLLGVNAEREQYRARMVDAASQGGKSTSFFTTHIQEDWAQRLTILSPPVQRAFSDLCVSEGKLSATAPRDVAPEFQPSYDAAPVIAVTKSKKVNPAYDQHSFSKLWLH